MTGASFPIPFEIGSELWWIGNGYREEWVTCPECAGTKALTMIRGNGEQVSLGCACCSLGYDPPTGAVKRIFYDHRPTRFVPRRVRVDGDRITYSESEPESTCYSSSDAKDLFPSKDECQQACDKLNVERTKDEEKRAMANLQSKRRNMAFSVHYWGRKVKDLERDLEVARKRLTVSKEKQQTKEGARMPTQVKLTIVLCRRCGIREVDDEMDMCGECIQETIDQARQDWFDRRAKESRCHF